MSFCLYNKKNIIHGGLKVWILFSRAKTIFYSLVALVRKILFCHSKMKFISSRHRVISSTYISQLVRYPTIQSSDCKTDNKQVIWFELIWFPTLSYTRSLKKVPFQAKPSCIVLLSEYPRGRACTRWAFGKGKHPRQLRTFVYLFIYLFIYQLFWTQAFPEWMCTKGTQRSHARCHPCPIPHP